VQLGPRRARELRPPLPATPIHGEAGKAATAEYIGEDAANSAAMVRSCRPSTSDSRIMPTRPNPGRPGAALVHNLSSSWTMLPCAGPKPIDFLTRSLNDCIGWERSRNLLNLSKKAIGRPPLASRRVEPGGSLGLQASRRVEPGGSLKISRQARFGGQAWPG